MPEERPPTAAAPRRTLRVSLPRGSFLGLMLLSGALTGAAAFLLVAASLGAVVPAAGWLAIAGQAFLLAWWTGNLRPRLVLVGLLVGLVGLAAGYFGAAALFLAVSA